MFSLRLTFRPEETEELSFALWEAGTVAIHEQDHYLLAGFAEDVNREELSARFAAYAPQWQAEDTDWVLATQQSWPGREVGERIFLAPVWNQDKTPPGRVRVIHNPGMASGTGEHPCTQLALEALEQYVSNGCVVVDVGTGSGILAIAALWLGARLAIGLELNSLDTAVENVQLNGFRPRLVNGSADCIATAIADVVVANINASVLLNISDDLYRIVKPGGWLIQTGFPESELCGLFRAGLVTKLNEWRCLALRL